MIKIDLENLSTEEQNKNTINIDLASSLEIVELINKEDQTVPKKVLLAKKEIAETIDLGLWSLNHNGRIIYLGSGTSGRIGVLDASEIPPTYNIKNNQFIGLISGGDYALKNAQENSEDNKDFAVRDLKNINFSKNDLLIGISASGRTPYVLGGIQYAKSKGAKTVIITTTKASIISIIADIKIEVPVGPEVITGSTRMKSGTLQKLILNTISTGIMIRYGKVYKNLMIDMKPSNEKLVQRSINIVKEITNLEDDNKIYDLLKKNQFNIKITSLMLKKNINNEEAKKLLQNNNNLRSVLKD